MNIKERVVCVFSAGVRRLAVEPADGPVQPSQAQVSQRRPPTGPPQRRLRGGNALTHSGRIVIFSPLLSSHRSAIDRENT